MAKLVAAAGGDLSENVGLEAFFKGLSAEKVESLAQHVPMWYTVQQPLSVLYIPMGWALLDRAVSGQIVTSVRASCAYVNDGNYENGCAAIPFFGIKGCSKAAALVNLANKAA